MRGMVGVKTESKKSAEEQLVYWLFGQPIHNRLRDECCPDFSCCNGELSDLEVRVKFVKIVRENDDAAKLAMLMMWLSNLLKAKY